MKKMLCKSLIPAVLFSLCFFCHAGTPVASETASTNSSGIKLMSNVQAGRIILFWDPPNSRPSDGIKIQRSLTPDFDSKSIDQYTKWLPGTGYNQVVLFPSAASEKTYYYRVSSIKTGEYAQCLAVSNPVKVDALKNTEEDEGKDRTDAEKIPEEQP